MGPIGADLIENTNATGGNSQGAHFNLSYQFRPIVLGGDVQSKDDSGPKSPVTEQPHRNSAPRI